MKNKKDRSAIFICSLSYKMPNKKIVTVVGKIKGTISKFERGKKGFGYDPIFIPQKQKKTFAQISRYKKIKMDHRYIAFKKLKKKSKFYKFFVTSFINI